MSGEEGSVPVRPVRCVVPVVDGCGPWAIGSVVLVDLPAFGRPVRLRWRKRRWTCPNPDCAHGSFVEQDPTIGQERELLTSRAAKWVTVQVGRWGEALLEADKDRIGTVPRALHGRGIVGFRDPRACDLPYIRVVTDA